MPNRFAMIPLQAASDTRLTKNDYRVLIALFCAAGKAGTCHPKRETLANQTGLSPRKVSASTAHLVAIGWLKKRGNGGRNSPAIYTIKAPETLPETVTVSGEETLSDSGTLSESKTLPEKGRVKEEKTLPETGTKTLPKTGRGKEKTMEKKKEKDKKEKENTWHPPDWINHDAWAEFEQHRREIRKPLSDLARSKAANQLQNLTHEQQQQCVDMTIQNHWQGLFPEKVTREARKPTDRTAGQQAADFFEDCKAYAAREVGGGTVRQTAIPLWPRLVKPVDDD